MRTLPRVHHQGETIGHQGAAGLDALRIGFADRPDRAGVHVADGDGGGELLEVRPRSLPSR